MSNPKLSILIPTLNSRKFYLDRLLSELGWQKSLLSNPDDVEILINPDDGQKPTGTKRNELIQNCRGEYVANLDDDDMVTDWYIKKQLEAANSGMDCGEFRGLYFLNGVYDRPFIHSLKYTHWYQDNNFFYRNPNHLSLIKKELILDIPFPDIYVGEDGKFSEALFASGRLKTEFENKTTMYLYYDKTKTKGQ